MCGVVAIYHQTNDKKVDHDILSSMNNSLHHRGPNDSGVFIDGHIGLGHTRLSIIDIASGKQPLGDHSGEVIVTYNGEIYNFAELRQELISKGYVFLTQSDTEVIVNAWREWGVNCLNKFNGMFAFVLWDKVSKTLFVARDRVGIKPMHWAKASDGAHVFSSELKSLKQYPALELQVDPQAIEDFLTLGYVLEAKSVFRSVNKLLPGHYILLSPEHSVVNPICYWDVKDYISDDSSDNNPEKLNELLSDAVQKRMVADVPLGAFLSGGVDSTAIVALMNHFSEQPINTCSIGFDLSKFDESPFAEKAAAYYKTNHTTTNVSINDLSLVDLIIDIYDEPFADNSSIPTLILSKATKEKVTVALSGDGSDELFFGYRNYQMLHMEEKIRHFFPKLIGKPLFSFLAKYYPSLSNAPRFLRAKSTFKALASDSISSYHNAMSLAEKSVVHSLLSDSFKNKLNGYSSLEEFQRLAKDVDSLSTLKKVQYIDFKTYLPGDILTKVDRASMVNSLEVRVPFLDHRLVEWGLGLRSSVNLQGRKVKKLLANSLKGIVPSFVLNRDKMGFTSPLDEWLRQIPLESLQKRILSNELLSHDVLCAEKVKELLAEHQSRQKDNGVLIWALLILESFFRKNSKNSI